MNNKEITKFKKIQNEIYSIANILRGPFKSSEFGDVILPFAVFSRFDRLHQNNIKNFGDEYLNEIEDLRTFTQNSAEIKILLSEKFKGDFPVFSTSKKTMKDIVGKIAGLTNNLNKYIDSYGEEVSDIMTSFDISKIINKLSEKNILHSVLIAFGNIDFSVDNISTLGMGYIFEELIRRFSEEAQNGDHYTPKEMTKLITKLLIDSKPEVKNQKSISVVDYCAGTAGMLISFEENIKLVNNSANITIFGQEYNDQSYAIAKSDMLIRNYNSENIMLGNTLTEPKFENRVFDFLISNPPYGQSWKTEKKAVDDEFKENSERFKYGLPAVSDGSWLFVQNMINKMGTNSRVGVVLSGSAFLNGKPGTKDSNIRMGILDDNLIETIVALPSNMFYNTPIKTYILILNNNKNDDKVKLFDATKFATRLIKSLGKKTNEITDKDVENISKIISSNKKHEAFKILDKSDLYNKLLEIKINMRGYFQFDSFRSIKYLGKEYKGESVRFNNQEDLVAFINENFSEKIDHKIAKKFIIENPSSDNVIKVNGKTIDSAQLKKTFVIPRNTNSKKYISKILSDKHEITSKTLGAKIDFTDFFETFKHFEESRKWDDVIESIKEIKGIV